MMGSIWRLGCVAALRCWYDCRLEFRLTTVRSSIDKIVGGTCTQLTPKVQETLAREDAWRTHPRDIITLKKRNKTAWGQRPPSRMKPTSTQPGKQSNPLAS